MREQKISTHNNIATVKRCALPNQSVIFADIAQADYHDAYCLENMSTVLNALDLYILMVNHTPSWINALLSLRNICVKPVGLKDVGNLGDLATTSTTTKYQVGDRLDLFHIDKLTDDEVILTLNDSHLDITISVLKSNLSQTSNVYVATAVRYNNLIGRLYMQTIKPFHKMVVQRLLNSLKLALQKAP